MSALILAADLMPSDVGTEVSLTRGETITGRLDEVRHTGMVGLTALVIDGIEYDVQPDHLVRIPDAAALSILGQPGRSRFLDRASFEVAMHLTVSALTHPSDGPGWDAVAAPWED